MKQYQAVFKQISENPSQCMGTISRQYDNLEDIPKKDFVSCNYIGTENCENCGGYDLILQEIIGPSGRIIPSVEDKVEK